MTELRELYQYAQENGIVVDCFPLEKREALSLLDGGESSIAIDPLKLKSYSDERTKLAHEIGHCATGTFYNCYTPYGVRQKFENQANKWAIRFLIPVEDLDAAIADGYTEIWSLAEHFGITEELMQKAVCWYTHGNLAAELYF